jgi:hypothetical protein
MLFSDTILESLSFSFAYIKFMIEQGLPFTWPKVYQWLPESHFPGSHKRVQC